MTAQAVESETPAKCGLGSAGRKGPLSHFIQEMKDGINARLLRQRGKDSKESSQPIQNPARKKKSQRTTGQGYRTQRRNRRPRNKSFIEPDDFKQGTKSRRTSGTRRNNGRHGSTSNANGPQRVWSAPTLKCDYCGGDVTFTNENRCEDCFADDQQLWHGRSLSTSLYKTSSD